MPDPNNAASVAYPPYPLTELREDLHHLLQPIIGVLRLRQQVDPSLTQAHHIERLTLALALTDVAAGESPQEDLDVRMARARHGCGFFRNEDGPMRQVIQDAHANGSSGAGS